jgi:hypothetical protein
MSGRVAAIGGRARELLFFAIAVLVMASSLYIAARRSIADLTAMFHNSAPQTVPAGMVTRVEFVKRRVPKGSLIVYYMDDPPDSWEFGLWERSLYPDYLLIPITGRALLRSKEFETLRYRYNAEYVLLANSSLPGLRDSVPLPDYPGAIPITLAKLEN